MKWKPVTRDLPKDEVLTIDKFGAMLIGYLRTMPDNSFVCETEYDQLCDITHYMELVELADLPRD